MDQSTPVTYPFPLCFTAVLMYLVNVKGANARRHVATFVIVAASKQCCKQTAAAQAEFLQNAVRLLQRHDHFYG
jgi:hypothetical protein